MVSLFRKKDAADRQLKTYRKLVTAINAQEAAVEGLTDEELRGKTAEFKERLAGGASIEDIKTEAFAVVREAAKRVLGMRHYDVQLIGGLILSDANIAEMATGEGKTLVASLPSYLRALESKGVHVITVNEYLAKRDRDKIGPLHEFLGLSVGLNVPLMDPKEKQEAYNADITYGVGTEFGFDYLRDNMVWHPSQRVQRPYHFAIIDEVDSVLIDEAKTPLIIAGKMPPAADLHYIGSRVAKRFVRDEDYHLDDETKAVSLTDGGIEKVEKAFGINNLYELEHQTLYHYMIQAVRAHVMFEKDVDYIVKDGKILLVDMFTGRTMEGRTLSDGLHQAIEAKEGLEITDENKTQASITIQNYFRMYPFLSGMTGTAKTEEKELLDVYNMQVIPVPTNRPVQRVDMPDRIYRTIEEKYAAVTAETAERHASGQPVLVGTTSILQSEKIARHFEDAGLSFELLNAKSVEQEVELISRSGQRGHITIATNMAGRGTDILLGEGVPELGGLHVIGTERHESRRIDNQLKGRAGRQGDPGSSEFIISLEDAMFRRFAKDDLAKLEKKIQTNGEGLVTNKKIHEFVDRVQRIVEGSNYSIREYNLKLDDVINEQRGVIFGLRNAIIDDESQKDRLADMIKRSVQEEIDHYCHEEAEPEEWALDILSGHLQAMFGGREIPLPEEVSSKKEVERTVEPVLSGYLAWVNSEYDPSWDEGIKRIMTADLDAAWVHHLEQMTRLKEGIGLRHYQQEDPMRIYAREGLQLFQTSYRDLLRSISAKTAALMTELTKKEN
ncbi:accessory Sec system translocase SecA2 [Domibacillus sp. PGB-M46]|uniref:accessory Sec system translocase SecA2 n=1 Tax=Domibacillus sp. PGB-M46 TaxID=2910255 RepID=UPI001F59B3E1|nr:accessory Sec system translocase SecA2 [Domibacillus sp. PGB-M46]MCI2253032.1 accessory Sec system translocase SecA2 [Domibacillus sp. PGB-M46]